MSSDNAYDRHHGEWSTATSASSVQCLAGLGMWSIESGHRMEVCKHPKMFSIISLDVGFLEKKAADVIETVSKRKIDSAAYWR